MNPSGLPTVAVLERAWDDDLRDQALAEQRRRFTADGHVPVHDSIDGVTDCAHPDCPTVGYRDLGDTLYHAHMWDGDEAHEFFARFHGVRSWSDLNRPGA